MQPIELDKRVFSRAFITEKNPSASFESFINEAILNAGHFEFGDFVQYLYDDHLKHIKRCHELVLAAEMRESEIENSSEYTFHGRELSRMTGLFESDLEDLRSHLQPFSRSFAKITIDEAITIFFMYARLDF